MKVRDLFEAKPSDDEMVILKKEHENDKTFWNGVAWMGTKAQAEPVKKSEVAALERQYRTRTKAFPVK